MLRKVTLTCAVLLLSLVTAYGSANATTVSYNASAPSDVADWVANLLFPKFNSALGTLNSVSLLLSGSFDTDVTVTNSGGAAASKTGVWVLMNFYVDTPVTSEMLGIQTGQLTFNGLAAGNTIVISPAVVSGNNSLDPILYTDAGALSAFTGSGNITLPVSAEATTTITYKGTSSATAEQYTLAWLDATLTYDYTETPSVPIPPTVLLLAPGLVGAVLLRRRTKA